MDVRVIHSIYTGAGRPAPNLVMCHSPARYIGDDVLEWRDGQPVTCLGCLHAMGGVVEKRFWSPPDIFREGIVK